MDRTWQSALWGQFGASITMLGNALRATPDEVWETDEPQVWYLAYHTLFFLDYYLADGPEGFAPPAPFTLAELDPEGVMPERTYTKAELLAYLEHGRQKCRARISSLTEPHAPSGFGRGRSHLEMLLYNLRHVQHHAAQLNLLLRQRTGSAPPWVGREQGDPG